MKLVLAAAIDRPEESQIDSFVETVQESLRELGHEVDVFRLPAILERSAAMEYALALGMLDLGAEAHRLITLGGHCHLLRHPAKIAVIHPRDELLDLVDTESKPAAAAYTRSAIAAALRGARRVVVPDRTTSDRIGALAAIEPLVCGPDLAKRETAETWLD